MHKRGIKAQIGDIGFADDTQLLGEAEEMAQAEVLLQTTMQDWKGVGEKSVPKKGEWLPK